MLIMFEGPDGCGKTTLADVLSAKLNIPIYRQGRPPISGANGWHDIYKDRQRNFITLNAMTNLNLILDRWHMSEMVYSIYANTMLGEKRCIDNNFDEYVANAYKYSILVLAKCNYKTVCERAAKRDGRPYEFTEEQFNFIANEFEMKTRYLPFKHKIRLHTDSGISSEKLIDTMIEQTGITI